MPSISFEGQVYYVPGVYDTVKVATSLPGPLPAFHIPVILGDAWEGHPYNADASKQAGEDDYRAARQVNTEGAVGSYFGQQCEMHRAMKYAKRHGLPFAFGVCLSPLTRASVIVEGAAAVEQFTLYPKSWGAPGGWLYLSFTAATHTLTISRPKFYAFLDANLGASATRITVKGSHAWLVPGLGVLLGDNSVAPVAATITRTGQTLLASGQIEYWFEIAAALGGAIATADYALVYVMPPVDTETLVVDGSEYSQDGQGLIDLINDRSRLAIAVKHANFSNLYPVDVLTPLALAHQTAWNTPVPGTSPPHTGADVTAFVTLMNAGEWDAFAVVNQVLPQAYLLVSSAAPEHVSMRDYATAERARGYPISVTAGCAWGDHVLAASDATNPKWRAAALDSENFCLVAGGIDREASYISRAAGIWGRRVAGGPGHNLTNDQIVFSELERKWDEIDSGELSALLRAGVATHKLSVGSSILYKEAQGISTLQNNNGLIWNVVGEDTWSLMQRDLADFVSRVIKSDFESQLVGADEVDPNAVAAVLLRRAKVSLLRRSYITDFTITDVTLNDAASGYDVEWSVRLPTTNDFMTVTTTILIGD